MDVPMPVPTPATVLYNIITDIGAIIYFIVLLSCILFLIYCGIIDLRDYIRSKRINKYLYDDRPVEYILDYPYYALEEYINNEYNEYKKHNE